MITDPNKAHYLTRAECDTKTAELLDKQNTDPNYMIELKFIKDNWGWYADVPTHTRSQNAMVAGSDKLLDAMAHGCNELTVKFRFVENKELRPIVTLKRMTDITGLGATYLACGMTFIPFPCYICEVGHDVYGNAPKRLYVYDINCGGETTTKI